MQSGRSLPRSVVKRYELMVVVLRKFFITVMGVIFSVTIVIMIKETSSDEP